jgi:hypothetical protein
MGLDVRGVTGCRITAPLVSEESLDAVKPPNNILEQFMNSQKNPGKDVM